MIEVELVPFGVRDTARLFLDTYAYKIRCRNPAKQYYCDEQWNGQENLDRYCNRVATRNALYDSYLEIHFNRFLPFFDDLLDVSSYHLILKSSSINFYFKYANDFNEFISRYEIEILEVTRPTDAFDKAQLQTSYDLKRSYRKEPYFGLYEFKVLFEKDCDCEALDSWVSDFFQGDSSRFHYDVKNKQRALYLRTECDVALTKMSHYADIVDINQII